MLQSTLAIISVISSFNYEQTDREYIGGKKGEALSFPCAAGVGMNTAKATNILVIVIISVIILIIVL